MSGPLDAQPFDLEGPLPRGITVLEASAGTGKTHAIAELAARYVAEGTPIERILAVTFTRMATGELRERVRERLGPRVADFDAATIATTHGFCEEVLRSLGTSADLTRDTAFAEDLADLEGEVVDDLYVRRFARGDDRAPFGRAEARRIARAAVENPSTPLAPASGTVPEMRRRLAHAVREEVEERKQRVAVIGYDDLLTRLAAALRGPGGEAVRQRLRSRYDVVLVDEFQDTDPVQWEIVRSAFGDGGRPLVLIGDPKQAIYAFRGADVYAYLEAARAADRRQTLDTNWRSDQPLLDAFDALFGNARLGHEAIVYRRVRAAERNRRPRLSGAPCPAPLRLRVVPRDTVERTNRGFARVGAVRDRIAADLAADVAELLSSGAEIERRDADGATTGRAPVCPADVAVLVATNRDAARIRDALQAAGVPAVVAGAGSVFTTPAAREWLRLLDAVERPSVPARARAAALTCFLGWPAERVATADEAEWEELHRRLHGWARVLRDGGVASLTQAIASGERLPERVLAQTGGERHLTDVRHVGELLHAAASAERLGPTALTAWLRRRIAEAGEEVVSEERTRRLESDAQAVQVLTVHRSKGLEFGVVYAASLWEAHDPWGDPRPVVFHDPAAGDARMLDVALAGSLFEAHQERERVEERGEELRLAYVALTRARHQAVVWWAGTWPGRNSPLSRLLFHRAPDGTVAPFAGEVPGDEAALERLQELAAHAPGCVSVERVPAVRDVRWSGPSAERPALAAAVFDRRLDQRWRRTSYSAITAAAHEARVGSEPDEDVVADEPADAEAVAGGAEAVPEALAAPVPLGDMPVGVHVGTLVHRVFEATDFAAPDLDGELRERLAAAQARRAVDLGDEAVARAGLRAALQTPLGPLLGERRLCDVARADRLDELAFELPLVGGDAPAGRLTLRAIGAALDRHLPPGDPLAGYAARLADPALEATLRGYLTGSLDLVVRVPGADGAPRFAVLDYKTNRLAAPDEVLAAWHHRPAALEAEMHRRHYGLQAILYTVALHRYLRWRVAGYEPERHLAGVLYLFVRGLTGADTPRVDGAPCGVFAWRPPGALVAELSDLLDRGEPA